ncbi:MAG: DinB family protein [Gemmatimonadetes bacterium]|nr:DinB family protein [Gemmatimonadota bacterium]NNM06186.1 DinB family protein [Gemmatimonadota bacterium]
MSIAAAMLPEFDQEMAKTRDTLARVPEDKFGWKPHEKSFSFMEMANHIARLSEWGTATLSTESMDLDPEKGEFVPPPPAETLEGVLAAFDKSVADFRTALTGISDEDLMKPWTLRHGENELFTMPRVAVVRAFVMNHLYHHRGQLTVYLRLNDLPLPALYGPSADEGQM